MVIKILIGDCERIISGDLTFVRVETGRALRIAEGRSPFEELGSFELDDFVIYELEGIGQTHYYWQSGRLVLWLAADGELAERALGEVVIFY